MSDQPHSDQPRSDQPRSDRPDASPSRRTVLRAAGVVALVGGGAALAACSSDAGTAAPAVSSAPASSAPASSAAASASPSSSASAASSSAAAPSGPSVATSEVPVGGGVILKDADYVVTQPTKGTFKAFSKICTHKGCPVADVAGGTINCNCHGSKFSIEDGSVKSPPATSPLKESPVTVSGGKVVVDA